MAEEPGLVTVLLARASSGDDTAFDELFPLVYQHLRRSAAAALRGEHVGHTLQPTALVHEAYLKLVGSGGVPARDRGHFQALAARAMRQILVDHARRRRADKRGKGEAPVALDFDVPDDGISADELIALDDALMHLEARDPRQRAVVELRYFGGLTDAEISAHLDITTRTVQRDWLKARTWLYARVYGEVPPE